MSVSAIKIYNVTCTVANTEYNQALTSFCHKFTIKTRGLDDLKVAFVATHSGTLYYSIPAGSADTVFDFGGFAGVLTVYFQSPNAGAIVEIVELS